MQLTINFLSTHESFTINNLKKIWIYPYNVPSTLKKFGLAIADDNWDKKTIIISSDKKLLCSLEKEIILSHILGKKSIDIKE